MAIVAWNLVLVFLPLPNWFFMFHFLFWRAAYNLGLGFLLSKQSTSQLATRLYQKFCITCTSPDSSKHTIQPFVLNVLKRYGLPADYDFEVL
jgi:hypothetical protein